MSNLIRFFWILENVILQYIYFSKKNIEYQLAEWNVAINDTNFINSLYDYNGF